MENFEKLFEDFFAAGFGRPRNLKFNADGTRDMNPVFWRTITDDEKRKIGFKATCRTVGLSPEDVKITLEQNCIIVEGKSEFDGAKYDIHYEIPVSESVVGNIENIKYKTLNGLTYIYIYIKAPEFTKINIEKF